MIEITNKSELDKIMTGTYDLVVLDIYADWCGPCKYLTPKLEQLSKDYSSYNVIFCKLNVETKLRQVQALPTIEYWLRQENKRNLVDSFVGANIEEIVKKINTHLNISTPVPDTPVNKQTPSGTCPYSTSSKNFQVKGGKGGAYLKYGQLNKN
jgi:thioredoxin 1